MILRRSSGKRGLDGVAVKCFDDSAMRSWQLVFGNTSAQKCGPCDVEHCIVGSTNRAIIVAGVQSEPGHLQRPFCLFASRHVRMAPWSQNDAFARDVP